MTPEELAEADKLAGEGSIARLFLDHIAAQADQIEALEKLKAAGATWE